MLSHGRPQGQIRIRFALSFEVGIDPVSVLRMRPDTFIETDKRHGQVIRSERMMVKPGDAMSMNIIVADNRTGATIDLKAKNNEPQLSSTKPIAV